MRTIRTLEEALAYPSERLRTLALQRMAQLPSSHPRIPQLLGVAQAFAHDMSSANQARLRTLCHCAEMPYTGSLGGDDDDDEDDEESTDWADAIGKGLEALFTGGAKVATSAIQADAQRQQQELLLKLTQAKATTQAAQTNKVNTAVKVPAKATAKPKLLSTSNGHFQKHWGKYVAGVTVLTVTAAVGTWLYKRQQQAG